ncbi:hypothetical protein [uncultured Aquimarina sp.]|uniref:hypothetical protein n=1 Tax=uncultured Aquimarina sp. TaxID=575652 RepID=UPI002615BD66|nr:hypothetical protein [uncultured Aquimarina sp.]
MKTKNHIQNQVEQTIEITETISKVQPSPFLREKMMNRLFNEKEEISIFSWFTPKYQLITLTCIVLLNVYVIAQYNKSNYDENVSNFAQNYELSINESLFN